MAAIFLSLQSSKVSFFRFSIFLDALLQDSDPSAASSQIRIRVESRRVFTKVKIAIAKFFDLYWFQDLINENIVHQP